MKNPPTPAGIEPATFRFVATAVPNDDDTTTTTKNNNNNTFIIYNQCIKIMFINKWWVTQNYVKQSACGNTIINSQAP